MHKDERIERVAKAIADDCDDTWDKLLPEQKDHFRCNAIAAIRALEASRTGAGDVMREALIKCRDQFLFYAESHRAKETPDGYAKAVTNQNMAMMCEDALTTPTRIEAAQPQEAETAWLIERHDLATVESRNSVCLHYYAEWPTGKHYWTPDHMKAKRFVCEDAAKAVSNNDPLLSVVEHMWINTPPQAAEMKDDEHTPVIGSNKIRRTFKKPNNQSSQAAESGLLDIMCEASCDAFMSQIVVDGNGGLEFLPEALDAALKAAKAGKPQP